MPEVKKWKMPPKIKVYEALGAVADGRVEVTNGEAKVVSSAGNWEYMIEYDSEAGEIMTNDNGSYWQGYLGYPAMAYLMQIGEVKFRENVAKALKGVQWKEVNTAFMNDYDKTIKYVLELAQSRGVSRGELEAEVEEILRQVKRMDLGLLGRKARPPAN